MSWRPPGICVVYDHSWWGLVTGGGGHGAVYLYDCVRRRKALGRKAEECTYWDDVRGWVRIRNGVVQGPTRPKESKWVVFQLQDAWHYIRICN